MKKFFSATLSILFLLYAGESNAQFLKKLKQKAEAVAQSAVSNVGSSSSSGRSEADSSNKVATSPRGKKGLTHTVIASGNTPGTSKSNTVENKPDFPLTPLPEIKLGSDEGIIGDESCANFMKGKNLTAFVIKNYTTGKFRLVTIDELDGKVEEDKPNLTETQLVATGVIGCSMKERNKLKAEVKLDINGAEPGYNLIFKDNTGHTITKRVPGQLLDQTPLTSNTLVCVRYLDIAYPDSKDQKKYKEYLENMNKAPVNILVMKGKEQKIIKNIPMNANIRFDSSGEHVLYVNDEKVLFVDGINTNGKLDEFHDLRNIVFLGSDLTHWAYFFYNWSQLKLQFYNGKVVNYPLLPGVVHEGGKTYVKCYDVRGTKTDKVFGYYKVEL